MPIDEAAYLRVGLGFIPEDIKNEMQEKREDTTKGWRVPPRKERERLSESELHAIGADLVEGDDPQTQTERTYVIRKKKKPRKAPKGTFRMGELALAALEAHGFVERRVGRAPRGAEHMKNVRAYRKNKSKELRRKRMPQAKRKAKIAKMKHDRAFRAPARKGFIRYTKG